MSYTPHIDERLERALRQVAQRCRRRRLIYCLARFGLVSLGLVLALTLLLIALPLEGAPRLLAMGGFVLVELIAAWQLLIKPTRQSIDHKRVALLIDEKHPELENRITSAVDLSERSVDEQTAWIVERLLQDSQVAVERVQLQDLLNPIQGMRWAALAAFVWLALFGWITLNRDVWLPHAAPQVAEREAPKDRVTFQVEPGSIRVRQGDSPVVRVMSESTGKPVSIQWQTPGGEWQSASMPEGASPTVHFHQFKNLQNDVEYRVLFDTALTEIYRIGVYIPPEINSINLTYRYPDYLNLPPKETSHGGDITAVSGTEVDIAVHVNKPLERAVLRFDDRPDLNLEATKQNVWQGTFTVEEDALYRVELTDLESEQNEYVPEYRIAAQTDDPPEIRLGFPRDDLEATSIDELPFEFRVEDDFGLKSYGLQLEVAGREPLRIPLSGESATPVEQGEADHTLMLEDLGLAAGDLVTWAVWAEDYKPGRERYETLGYPYFLEIRPFNREFQEAVSDQSAQQQQQQQGGGNQTAMDQKEVLIATWNLRRDSKEMELEEFLRRHIKIREAQAGIKQQVIQGAAQPGLQGLGSEVEALLPKVLEAIDKALAALDEARWPEPAAQLSEAIRQMQMAHHLMLKMEPDRAQVQMAQGQQGGGGSGGRESQREMQELEMRRNRNFYEQERRVQEQREAMETALNDLQELARRQKMINEEMNDLISEMQKADEEQRKELERRLERLREEERRAVQQLDQAARNVSSGEMDRNQARDASGALQEARRQMTRSLDNMEQGDYQQARAAGSRAERALGDAEEALQQISREAAAKRLADLQQKMQEMEQREEEIIGDIDKLKEEHSAPGSLREDTELEQLRRDVIEKKEELAEEFRETLEEAADLAQGAENSQELMSRRLGDWLRNTSRDEIPEQIEGTRQLVEYGIWDPALSEEERIRQKLEKAEQGLARVAQASTENETEAMRKALDKLKELREGEEQARSVAQAGEREQNDSRAEEERQAIGTPSQDGEADEEAQSRAGAGSEIESEEDTAAERAPGNQIASADRQPSDGEQARREGESGQRANTGDSNEQQMESESEQSRRQDGSGESQEQGTSEQNRGLGESDQQQSQRASAQNQTGGGSEGMQIAEGGGWNQDAGGRRTAGGMSGGGGEWNDWLAPRSNEEMQRFMDRESGRWVEGIRDAESLLPEDGPQRDRLENAREALLRMRRQYRGAESRAEDNAPTFDLLKQLVGVPLGMAAEDLERQIQKREDAEKLILTDEQAVPEKYRQQVAVYYEALSESAADE